jgi:hypothetical protein
MDQAGETILRLRNENAKLREEVKWGGLNLDSCISGQDALRKQLDAANLQVEQLKSDIVKVIEADASEVRNLKLQVRELREALKEAHGCATLTSDGTCYGCKVSAVLDKTEKPKDEGCENCGRPDRACEEHGKPVGVSKSSGPGFCGVCLAVMPCKVHG